MDAIYRFAGIEVHRAQRQLLVEGVERCVGARAFDLLLALIDRRGELVRKTELLNLVWPGMVVEENNLQVQISNLRRVLGIRAIATIPGYGYRFTAALDRAPGDESRASMRRSLDGARSPT